MRVLLLPFIGFLVHQYVLGISVCYMGIFPLCLGFWQCSAICWGVGASAHGVFICLFLYILVAHYVSCSTMAMTTTAPVTVVSSGLSSVSSVAMAPSLMGLPVTLDQCGVVQPPPLMLRGSGGVIGPASVPQQQPQSSMPLLAYANYAISSPQVGFFSELSLPLFCILYVWCSFWCLLSTFRC